MRGIASGGRCAAAATATGKRNRALEFPRRLRRTSEFLRDTIMPNHEPNFITAIDVGSAKTSVLVAELSENGLRYRGHGISESRGLRKGVITELDKAVSSIQKAVEHAEDVAGHSDRACADRHCGRAHSRDEQPRRHQLRRARRGKSAATKSARRWTRPAPCLCPPIAKFCICCRRNSFSTISRACRIRWA